MRSNNQFHVLVSIEIRDENIFIRCPGTSGHQSQVFSPEQFYHRQFFCLPADFQNPVETGIPHHGRVGYSYFFQKFHRFLILHKKMSKAFQDRPIFSSVPTEEQLLRTEDGRNTIYWYIPTVQFRQVVFPELVFYKESHTRTGQFHKPTGIGRRIQRQVTYHIGPLIILPHLVSRRREESLQNLIVRITFPDFFNQRPALFEFSQGCRVKPDVFRLPVNTLL